MTTAGTTLYVANFNNSTMDIFDISIPPNPVHVRNLDAGALNGPEGLTITDTTLYAANFNNSTVTIFDISIPPNPVRVANFGAGALNGPFGLAIFTVGG